jgi:hypothetical protein
MSSTRKMSEHPSPPYNLPGEAAAVAEAAEAATEVAAEVAAAAEVAEVAAAAEVAAVALQFGGEVAAAAAVEAAGELGSDGAGDHKRT